MVPNPVIPVAAQRSAGTQIIGRAGSRIDAVASSGMTGVGDRVVQIARTWLATPYRHQGATRGAGCDCLGLIRGVWSELYGVEAQTPPPYRPDWAEVCDGEPMLDAARRWLVERPVKTAAPGDALLFRMSPAAAIKHAAILSAAPTAHDPHARMIHAYWGRAVVESWLGPWWRRRWVAAFSFPALP